MSTLFRAALASGRIIVFDGAMGTMLAERGVEPGSGANIINPAAVQAVHQAYRGAGAEVLTTNTFDIKPQMPLAGANAMRNLDALCKLACQYARDAAIGAYVAGDIGSRGAVLAASGGTFSEATVFASLQQTARLLADNGVDIFIVETMTDVREMELAIGACKAVAKRTGRDIPIAATMSFDPSKRGGFRTNMGVSPVEAARAMDGAGADIIGANCGSVTPEQMAEIVREFKSATNKPILIQPNAGVPELQAGQTIFRLAPEAFGEGMKRVLEAGAQLVGGCCGTTPEHIRRLRQTVDAFEARKPQMQS